MTIKSIEVLTIAILSILVGSLYIGPALVIEQHFERSGKNFTLAQFKTYRNSLLHYLPRAREIYDGNFPPADLSGNTRGQPTVMNTLTSTLFAASIFIAQGNINTAYLLAQFIFSALAFVGFYLAGRTILGSRLWSVLMALTGTLTPIPGKLPFYDWQGWGDFLAFFVKNFIPVVKTQFDKLYLAQIDNPLLTVPFYLLTLAALYHFWKKPSAPRSVLAGSLIGLMFYIYFHFWVFIVVLAGILSAHVLLFESKNMPKLKNFGLLLATAALISIPYFINYVRFTQLPTAGDYADRLGLAKGRIIGITSANIYDYIVYVLAIIAIYLLIFKKNKNKSVFLWGLCLTMVTVWNIQLVIGYVPVPHTWFKTAGPVLFIIIFALLHEMTKTLVIRWTKFNQISIVLLVLLSIVVTAKKVVNILSIRQNPQPHLIEYYRFPEDISLSWSWINKNLEPEPKIVSPSTMAAFYLNTYTSARPFLPTGFTALMSMKEIEERYLTAHKLFEVPEDALRQRLERRVPSGCIEYECPPDKDSNLNDSVWHIYGNYFASKYGTFRNFMKGNNPLVIERAKANKFDDLITLYRDWDADWKNVAADYVYYGPWEKQIQPSPPPAKELKLVYQNPSVQIYHITK
ncbi:MAG: hypothetical protein AAB642_01795 [Patescibacteria group bacterium]